MNQDSIRPPGINQGSGYSSLYTVYLHCMAWALRMAVASMTGTGKLYDRPISVPTPEIGEGKVNVSACIPKDLNASQISLPLLLVIQGGGFILGQPTDGEHIDRNLCDKVGMIVVSVDYAKAPRYPYPHALLQLYEVLKWALSPTAEELLGVRVDASRVAVMGNSAGGNLTASLSLLLSFTNGPCAAFRQALPANFRQCLQILLYPSLDLSRDYGERFGDTDQEVQARSLPVWAVSMMEASYLPPYIDKTQIFVAPLNADVPLIKSLAPPSAVILTAGQDCLKREAQLYSEKLKQADVSLLFHEYPDAIHGFSHYTEGSKDFRKEDVEDCWSRICSVLQEAFASKVS
ncbi:hypothetical protein FPRO04_14055 [Fusarium proliferatum]|uniref:Alpha/beta hydrolase fold-3 domain-containing protein n=2 Tax=Fusarium oxysporum TaxID=5507 RepID=A0A420MBC1_FUSOX|nr:hypothetical protein FPRO04_14055 [Fusarium proliferatum]RKK06689.1 hypothetical protein BFJ65_g18587 [Fusarium oxysporum f. sp. cepae]RKK65338.1 hypothetical protein BFJ69_g16379 [Fusarium oxysporum]RKK26697.1 hypothetical protein BFJ67_g16508 [Fusarium oxysporum f. sp. cepae]RKK27724.1 hypothetical protein BFJ66_g16523 [Fusarium oxysporum f. sp. cepae]